MITFSRIVMYVRSRGVWSVCIMYMHSFFAFCFSRFFHPQNHSFPLINILLLKMTDWFAHIIIMCELLATKCDFLLAGWLPCHRHNTAKSTKQTTVSTRTVFSSAPRNLFTMTLVNRSCTSSANLMSKPFLIYCRIFFGRHRANAVSWMQIQLTWTTKLHLYTRLGIVLYTSNIQHIRGAKSFLSTFIYNKVNISKPMYI